jgi:glycine/D-amino acid oxidase-like deaminating enzyme
MAGTRVSLMPRVAVIGAGIIGATVAFRLAEKGLDVLLLDRGAPGHGATAASYAWVNANAKLPRAWFDLNVAAMQEYRRLAWRLAPAYWYHVDGNLIWYANPGEEKALRERVARLRAWGYAAEMLPAREVLVNLEPGLAGGLADQQEPFAWFPEEAWVEPLAMTKRMVEMVRNVGGRVLAGDHGAVVGIGVEEGRVRSVALAGGQTIAVVGVVNAAGANADRVAAMAGRRLPMASPPGMAVHAALPDDDGAPRRPIETDGIFMRPNGAGRALLAIDNDDLPELDDAPLGSLPLDHPLVVEVMRRGAAVFPALAAALPAEALVALRPMPADGFASVGGVASIPGYYEAVTHSGVTLAPLIARSLTEELLGRPPDPLFAPYSPERPALA